MFSIKLGKTNFEKVIKINPISKLLIRKRYYDTFKKITNSKTIYWIPPERIIYATNSQNETNEKKRGIGNGFSLRKMRGEIIDGNWDRSSYRFTDLEIYKVIKQTIEKNEELQDARFFKLIQRHVKSPSNFWGATNAGNLQKLFEYLNSPQINLTYKKTIMNRGIHFKNSSIDAIDVNIGRNGEYHFQNNAYMLSLAKLFRVKSVPVRVFVRHKQWQKFREFVINYFQQDKDAKGFLYQPIVHPDFVNFPTHPFNNCHENMQNIKVHLTKKSGTMLDIGANLGFFSHKFEDIGYKCYAIESNLNNFRILEKIRVAESKKFTAINKSIFEIEFIKTTQFDVVLALNIFHHFLKKRSLFNEFKELLQNLRTKLMFFSSALVGEDQMKNAYQNYSESTFVEFLLHQTSLSKSELIFAGRLNRHVYKLSK